MQRSPRLAGLRQSRWGLAGLRQRVAWLHPLSLVAVHHTLRRLGIHYKRGRRQVHSPDLAYDRKLALVQCLRACVVADPQHYVLVYEDELTYYRRPTLAQGYALAGREAPLARQGLRSNLKRRIAASLDIRTGRLFCWQRQHFDRHTLIAYYQALAAAYPQAEAVFVVQDNWPVHFHEDVLTALAASKVWLVRLPTYAPWTNPVEKVWHKLYRDLLHLHDFGDDWEGLKTAVQTWLDQFAHGSTDLLRYVGLCLD